MEVDPALVEFSWEIHSGPSETLNTGPASDHSPGGFNLAVKGPHYEYFNWPFKRVSFFVKGTSDAHITLGPEPYENPNANVYELILGGWNNTRSAIRRGHKGFETEIANARVSLKRSIYLHRTNLRIVLYATVDTGNPDGGTVLAIRVPIGPK